MTARLGPGATQLQGMAVDRSRPLHFKLDGRLIAGFAGDTVLSAVLAAGVDTAGLRSGLPMALTARHAPAIAPVKHRSDPLQALPMERVPATDGADYVTLGHRHQRSVIGRVLRRDKHSLHLDLDVPDALSRPWLGMVGAAGPDADMVVVGGGLAGMSAALAGAKRGQRVLLVEATPRLGGNCRLFGTLDGEETPEHAIGRLSEAIAKSAKISVLTSTEVFAIRPGVVRLHQVTVNDGIVSGQVLDVRAARIVLATGAIERLPIFAGNRLPGVLGALEAFELAYHYGVWPGKSAAFATSSSPAYRLAMIASNCGISVPRILDSRLEPQSRFIEFSKAYGITLASGSKIAAAEPGKKGLDIAPEVAVGDLTHLESHVLADRLIVCGGWQPELTLWHMAGGESRWNERTARLEPTTAPQGIALAGSAAGWLGRQATLASGSDAVDLLLGRERKPVIDQLIDPIYETPDAPTPIGDAPDGATQPAYLDGGLRYLARPQRMVSSIPGWLPFARKPSDWSLANSPEPLDIAGVAAGVQLGAIPPDSAGIVAQERVAMVGITQPTDAARPADLPLPPHYLEGRYPGSVLWVAQPSDQRQLGVGALIYATADSSDPLRAVGVVVRVVDGKNVVLVSGREGQTLIVREAGSIAAINLVEKWV